MTRRRNPHDPELDSLDDQLPTVAGLQAEVERLRAERDALAEDIRERIERSTAMLVDLGQATAEVVQLRSDLASERRAVDFLTHDLALAVGHTGAPADLLAELTERVEQAERERDAERLRNAAAIEASFEAEPVSAMLEALEELLPADPRPPAPDWLERRVDEAIAKSRARGSKTVIWKRTQPEDWRVEQGMHGPELHGPNGERLERVPDAVHLWITDCTDETAEVSLDAVAFYVALLAREPSPPQTRTDG